MKQLLVIRHGKSSWDMNGLSDHDRPLNERGLRDAPRMAAALKENGLVPGHIASSTAVRAATTARMLAEGLGYPEDQIAFDRSIYLASPLEMLRVIQQFDESVETALIFGHNPGMHELVNQFASSDWIDSFPTLAVGWLKLDIEFWGEADFGCGSLEAMMTPRLLD
ncbi:MAG: histidine phosphatase family protein [Verrucomicrobiales bacterium]|nr:histidine phosphatase family protein [Verrucomicrobiales bacterium]